MSTDKIWEISSTKLEDTLEIGEKLGQQLKGGEVIELVSDIGGGKTVFVRGLAKGINSKSTVQSPTFTISREYRGEGDHKDVTIHHFDFYRLSDPGIIKAELAESIEDERVVVAVEWSDIVSDVLPKEKITVHIKSPSENERQITIKAIGDKNVQMVQESSLS